MVIVRSITTRDKSGKIISRSTYQDGKLVYSSAKEKAKKSGSKTYTEAVRTSEGKTVLVEKRTPEAEAQTKKEVSDYHSSKFQTTTTREVQTPTGKAIVESYTFAGAEKQDPIVSYGVLQEQLQTRGGYTRDQASTFTRTLLESQQAQAREQQSRQTTQPTTTRKQSKNYGYTYKETPQGRISAVTKSDYLVNQPESLFKPAKQPQAVFGFAERLKFVSGEALLQQQKEAQRKKAFSEDTSALKGSIFYSQRKAFYEFVEDYSSQAEQNVKESRFYKQVPETKLITAVGFGAIEGFTETSKIITFPLTSIKKGYSTATQILESPEATLEFGKGVLGSVASDPARFGGNLLGSAGFFKLASSTIKWVDPVYRAEQKLTKELSLIEKNIKTGGKEGKPFVIDYGEIVTPPKKSTSYSPETKIKTNVYEQIPTSTYVGYGSTKDLIIKDLIDVPDRISFRTIESPKYPKARIEIISDFEAGTQTTSFFYGRDNYSKLNPLRKTTTPLKSSFDDLVTGIKQSKFSAEILEGTKKKKTLTQLDKTYYQFQTADGSVKGISENLLKQDIRLMKPARDFKVGSGVRFDTGTKAITEYTISKKTLPTEVDFGKSLKQYDTLNLKSDPFALIKPNKAYGFDITGNKYQAPRVRSTKQQAYSNVFRWSSAPMQETPLSRSKSFFTKQNIKTPILSTGSEQSAVLQQPKLQTQQVVTQQVPISKSKTYSGLTRTKSAIKYQTKFSTMTKSKSLLSTKSALATRLLTRSRSKTLLQQQTTPVTQLKNLTQTKQQTRLKTDQLLDLRLRQQQMTQQLTTTSGLSSKAISLPKSPNFPKVKKIKPKIPFIPPLKLNRGQESSRSTFKSRQLKQPKAYTPSVTAVLNKLRGSTTKVGIKSGLAIRPIKL